jgi:hypothetical protein
MSVHGLNLDSCCPPGVSQQWTKGSYFQPKSSNVIHLGFIPTVVIWRYKSCEERVNAFFLSRLWLCNFQAPVDSVSVQLPNLLE